MFNVRVVIDEGRSIIGNFRFIDLPRKGEEIDVPWPEDPDGVRIFVVEEVVHYAEGLKLKWISEAPSIDLRVSEVP